MTPLQKVQHEQFLDDKHAEWGRARFAADRTHAEDVLDTLSGFLDSPVIEAKEPAWRPA